MTAIKDMIFRRRSVRAYEDRPLSSDMLTELMTFAQGVKRLYPDIPVEIRLLERGQVSTLQPWSAPHFLALFSREAEGWLENAGFMLQQMDLFLQAKGLGSCWVGLGWPEEALIPEGMKHVILMPFGYPKDVPERSEISAFRRRTMEEITDQADPRLEAVRVAPSACNSQPWYFVHAGDAMHVYRVELSVLKRRTMGKMNQIDTGIALAHLYMSCDGGFSFSREDKTPVKEGYIYMGTVRFA